MSGKRVLICRSNPVAPDPRVEKLARCLHRAGYLVRVLGWDRTAELPSPERFPYGDRILLPVRAEFGRGLGNLKQLLRWQLGLLRWLYRNRRGYEVLHACDFDTVLPCVLMKALFRKHVVYDIFDFYADHLRATPAWIKAIIRRLDLFVIDRVDAVILADEARRVQIKGTHPKRLEVIYNTPEDWKDNIPTGSSESKTPGRDRQALGSMQEPSVPPTAEIPPQADGAGFRIAYVGLLQVERGLVELLTVLARHPEWRLELAGFGGDAELLTSSAEALGNVRFHGRVPYDQALTLMATADVLIATYDPAIPNHRFASPNKLFEAMMLAKPVVVAEGTNIDRIVHAVNCGIVIQYGDPGDLEQALGALAADELDRHALGSRGREAYESEFAWERMCARLTALYGDFTPADS